MAQSPSPTSLKLISPEAQHPHPRFAQSRQCQTLFSCSASCPACLLAVLLSIPCVRSVRAISRFL